jgi:hypothetical protein
LLLGSVQGVRSHVEVGIWDRLLSIGVHGHIWQVIRDFYRDVSSRVVVNGVPSQAFRTNVGVRQGSVLSPILFSVFISDVIKEWERRGLGVRVGSRTVAGLLFADDIVLIGDTPEQLHAALAVMDEHARCWRYRFNASKCAVLAMGARDPSEEKWTLQNQPVPESRNYKYLGVTLEALGAWTQWHDARIAKGKRCLPTMWWCGARQGALPHATAVKLVEMMLWPSMSYGGELAHVGVKQAAAVEVVQNAAARRILGVTRRTHIDLMRGELGWHSIESRRLKSQLTFFHQLQSLPPGRLSHDVFVDRMATFMERAAHNRDGTHMRATPLPIFGLLPVLHAAMEKYELEQYFTLQASSTKGEWRRLVTEAVDRVEQRDWSDRLDGMDDDAATFYRSIKVGEEERMRREERRAVR